MKKRLLKLLEFQIALRLSLSIIVGFLGVLLHSYFIVFLSGFNTALIFVLVDSMVRNDELEEHIKKSEEEVEQKQREFVERLVSDIERELKARGMDVIAEVFSEKPKSESN